MARPTGRDGEVTMRRANVWLWIAAVLARGRLPAPYDDFEVDIWGQSREAWRARR